MKKVDVEWRREVALGYAITREVINDVLYKDRFRWTFWQTVKHQFFDTLILVGLRDRLRCPKCKAVGTWKPHGGWLESISKDHRSGLIDNIVKRYGARKATNRRWLCKYCGYNLSTDGEHQCYPNDKTKVWALGDEHSLQTPLMAVERIMKEPGPIWPWRG